MLNKITLVEKDEVVTKMLLLKSLRNLNNNILIFLNLMIMRVSEK